MFLSSIFITATDTGAGKTWLTCRLIRELRRKACHALALKPVASGLDDAGRNEDIEALLAAQQLHDADAINLYRFSLPAAPAIAAKAEGCSIDSEHLLIWCRTKVAQAGLCLLEGVGGLMVPLGEDFLVSDWIRAMPETRVWLVAHARLGGINHTLLSLDKLEAIGRPAERILINIMNAEERETASHLAATLEHLAPGCPVHLIGTDGDTTFTRLAKLAMT